MGSQSYDSYDFIVVGAGPAGCALAASLVKSAKRPNVLLLEAGERNDDETLRVSGKRWVTMFESNLNWGYQTTPQEHCSGRQINYSRGKGLGGSSAINFGVYTVGASDDYDQWAAEVGDDTFGWIKMKSRFKALETFKMIACPEKQKYGAPQAADHGDKGALGTGYAAEWESDLPLILDAFEEAGLERNMDHNSGNPIGMGLMINSVRDGVRTTAVDLLRDTPENLSIVVDCLVQRVIFEGKKAVGVETNGRKYFASKEVILSAGSLDSPRILMHSGIGSAAELTKFNIPVIQDIPAIGKGLKDHPFTPLLVMRNPETNDRNAFFKSPEAMDAAMKQWRKDFTGPWARYGSQLGAGWFKSSRITSSEEFKALPAKIQDFLNRETIPHYEIVTGLPLHMQAPVPFKDFSYICLAVFLMNEQSIGEVRLQSSNSGDPLLFDPHFLEHPYDRRACIEIYRHLLEVVEHPAFAKDTTATVLAPATKSDEDILQFWKDNTASSWHMTGTIKMGKNGNQEAAVDNTFRVFGVENLRVADMSVVPVMTNNHTQATAYVTGVTCGEVLIKEYGLDQ